MQFSRFLPRITNLADVNTVEVDEDILEADPEDTVFSAGGHQTLSGQCRVVGAEWCDVMRSSLVFWGVYLCIYL